MAFIGVITSKRGEEASKKVFINLFNENIIKKINVIIINESNIDNMKNVLFETVIINEDNSLIRNKMDSLKQILSRCKFLILNSDMDINLESIYKLKLTVITYGLNLKSTVTASSIEDEKLQICIQRSIKNIYNKIIEPKEMYINANKNDVYRVMEQCILEILYRK